MRSSPARIISGYLLVHKQYPDSHRTQFLRVIVELMQGTLLPIANLLVG